MAGEGDDEITVIVEDGLDTTLGADGKGSDDPVADLKGQLATLQETVQSKDQQLQQTAQVAQRATAEAAELRTVVDETRKETHETRLASIEGGISAAKSEADAAQRAYEDFAEKGDFKAMAEQNRIMSRAEANILRLTEAKDSIKDAPPEKIAERKVERREAPATAVSKVEQFATNMEKGGSTKSAAWIRQHPEFVNDDRKNAKLVAAHNDALAEGMALESPEYFAHVEKFVGLKGGTSQRRPSAPVASVQNSPGGMTGNTGNEVTLTRGEANASEDGTIVWNYPDPSGKNRWQKGDPIGRVEMARRKRELQKQGAYDPNRAVQQ